MVSRGLGFWGPAGVDDVPEFELAVDDAMVLFWDCDAAPFIAEAGSDGGLVGAGDSWSGGWAGRSARELLLDALELTLEFEPELESELELVLAGRGWEEKTWGSGGDGERSDEEVECKEVLKGTTRLKLFR